MSRRVVVTGAGVISSLGDSPAALLDALLAGRGALRPLELFPTDGWPSSLAGAVDFEATRYLQGNLRPVDRTGQLTLAAAHLALAAGGWTPERRAAHEVGLVLGTMFCSVHTISTFDLRALEAGPQYAKPFDFANSVLNAAAGQTAIWHDLRGVNSTIAGSTTGGLQAIAYAADLIRSGRCETLLAGGAEELCPESYLGFQRTGRTALPRNGTPEMPVPLDARRNGFVLAEGAALLMLEEAEAAARRGATVLAEIRGHGGAFDCTRGRDDDSATSAVARAVRLALADAAVEPDRLVAASLSANGSPQGDVREAVGLAAAVGEGAEILPVAAVKSMLGEPLGAGGAIQTLTLIESLARGRLPGVRGLELLDERIPLRAATASSRELDLARGRIGLVTALGLEGNVCALIVESSGAATELRDV